MSLINQDTELFKPVLDLDKYSNLTRVFRVTAWIKRFIANAPQNKIEYGEMVVEELNGAEKKLD